MTVIIISREGILLMVNKDKKHQTEIMALRRKIRGLEKRNNLLSEQITDERAKNIELEYELNELRKKQFESLKRTARIKRLEHDVEYWKKLYEKEIEKGNYFPDEFNIL